MDEIAEQLTSRLETDPNDEQAYEALKAHYLRTQDLASLTNLIAGWAGFQADPQTASRGYFEASRVVAQADPEHERRLALLRKAIDLDACFRDALTDLVELLPRVRDDETLGGFLSEHLAALEVSGGDQAVMSWLYETLAELWDRRLMQPAAAERCYERALDLAPTPTTVASAVAFAQAKQRWRLLGRSYEAAAQLASDTAERAELYVSQAQALSRGDSDWGKVVKALENAHNLTPDNTQIARELAGTYLRGTGFRDPSDHDAADLRLQVSRALPPHEAFELLHQVLRDQPDDEEALNLLEQHATALGHEEHLIEVWQAYIARAAPGPYLDRRRMAMSAVYERAGKLDDAIVCLQPIQQSSVASAKLAELEARRQPKPSRPSSRGNMVSAETGRNGPADVTNKPEYRLDAEPAVRELRRTLREAIAAQRQEEVVDRCREILEFQPHDLAAFTLLESHYRRSDNHAKLLQLLVESAKQPDLSMAERRLRWREVARLQEHKLRDLAGAITAWRNVLAVDHCDGEATLSLKRLLRRTERWSELGELLEGQVATADDALTRSAALQELAKLHLYKTKNLDRAAEILAERFALSPDPETLRELSEVLVQTHAYADAVPLLRQRAVEARGERERLHLLRELAEFLDRKLDQPEAAFEVYEEILKLQPEDPSSLDRMQHIDEQGDNPERLLRTLTRRCELLPKRERARLYLEMAKLAESALQDVESAGRFYRNAYELDPGRSATLDALCALFEERELHARLAQLLGRMAETTRDPARRVELGLRRARLLADRMGASSGAAAAYQEVLRYEENTEALRYLLQLARDQHDADTTASLCARLAAALEDRAECRALLYERAQLLVTELGRPRDAVVTLRNIVEEVDPDYAPAVEWLAELAGNLGDNAGVASALWRRLENSTTADARVALARRLADLHEHELDDKDAAIVALTKWAQADDSDVVPQRRLRRLLEEAGRYEELVATYDALSKLETERTSRDEATLRAAFVAATQLKAYDSAWTRLEPLVASGQGKAIELIFSFARQTNRLDRLAQLFEQAAAKAERQDLQKELRTHAIRIYRDELGQPQRAIDTALQVLDGDVHDRESLSQIEESVAQAGQWSRLSAVYDNLLGAAANDDERTELLVRYADLLERRAGKPDDALDLIMQACALSPDDEALMTQAEKLAASCDRSADLLALCDRQAATGAAPRVQVEWLLRGARFAATAEDRSAASTYLESALAAARADASLWERCVTLAQRLDGNSGDAKSHSYLAALITAHRRVAERSPTPVGVALMRRASRLVDDKLGDERMAFDLLRAGAALFPLDETMYDSLLERAEASGHLDALDAHLARGVEEALDPRTAACLLSRRARLLEGPLGRADDAANVYSKLLQLRPDDQQAASKLRESLRKARRFQDLLVVIHKQTLRAKQPDDKVELLKETAQVWELDLRNRWEAADAWAKVLELAPTDPEALRALSRLDRRAAPPSGPRAQGRVTPDLDRRQAPAQPSSDPNAPVLPPVAAVAAAPETRPLPPATLAAQEDSIELETLDESELEPVLETRRARRSTPPPPPPPPPPQALKSGTTPRRSSVVPPPPPPPPSKPKPS